MKIYIVTHESEDKSGSFSSNIISAHLSREKAEVSLKNEKAECLRENWGGICPNDKSSGVKINYDLSGLFEIHDEFSCKRDEILIHEENLID